MQENTLREFDKSVEVCDEVESKGKKMLLLFISNIILTFVALGWLYAENYHKYEEGKALFVMFLVFGVIAIVGSYKNMIDAVALSAHVTKNKLEIKNTYLSGIYTESPKTSDNEKYFKIPYNKIEKIEVKEINIKAAAFHNFIIYHSEGLIKLTIDSPKVAKDIICSMLAKGRTEAQTYKCPKCETEILFGQLACKNCGQEFDWSKL